MQSAVRSLSNLKRHHLSQKLYLAILAPGGSTIAGLLALEDGRVRSTIARSIQVATERASELGQPTTKEKLN